VPRPGEAGHLAYNHAILSHLAAHGHAVTVVLARPRLEGLVQRTGGLRVVGPGLASGAGWVAAARPKDAARILARSALSLLPSGLGESLRRRGRTGDYGAADAVLGRFLSEAEAEAAARLCAGADWVVADTIFRAPALAKLPPGPRRAIVTHDVFHARHAALSARGLSLFPPTLTAADEARWLAEAELLVAIQPEEEAVLATLAPGARVVTAPMPARALPRPPGIAREPARLVFIGSASAHNTDGLRWFLAEVWPLVRARLPTARLDVAGTVCREIGAAPEGVALLGRVDDLAPLLHRAGLAIAPLRAGSGLKIKLLDYAAHGLATVTTTVGAAGFLPDPAWPFVLEDNARGFAEAVLRLAGDDPALREAAALAYVGHYGAEGVFAPLLAGLGVVAKDIVPGDAADWGVSSESGVRSRAVVAGEPGGHGERPLG
jgi:glycosyltransferase involved in cell wall biosynthesis